MHPNQINRHRAYDEVDPKLSEEYVKVDGLYGSVAESARLLYQRNKDFSTRYFHEPRHTEIIQGFQNRLIDDELWLKYNGKERMKTVSVALVLCLHLGVEPPDPEPKPKEHAVLECWIDPRSCNATKAQNAISFELQHSYARWQPRARYKFYIDPTLDELKKLCTSMRRNARDERVLFHYNGHGVPRPTKSGEIWVFNKTFTQYIPVSICTLQTWLEFPCIYVWDMSSAENVVNAFLNFADQHMNDWRTAFEEFKERYTGPLPNIPGGTSYIEQARRMGFSRPPNFHECIHLAACTADQRLPVDPRLPADLFTSCLTSPIQTSIIWYLIKTHRHDKYPDDLLRRIPGTLTDRRTILGELNWIFTAITDTIAWNSLSTDIFQRLFRQDLLLASLFRAFLLAEKVMGDHGCEVVSHPKLPTMADHPLWESWELTLDQCLDDLDRHIFKDDHGPTHAVIGDHIFVKTKLMRVDYVDPEAILASMPRNNQHWFFLEQMQAFEVWLEYGFNKERPPEQLPVVLQVLLSQAHRTRALELLARFLDLGTWAVAHALSVGIFPYILKLLQSGQRELKPWLSFIWAKILAIEPHCVKELFKEIGDDNVYNTTQRPENPHLRFTYFLQMLNDTAVTIGQKVVPAYVIAMLFHGPVEIAQKFLISKYYVTLVTELLSDPLSRDWHLLRLWTLIGLGKMWSRNDGARWQAIRLAAANNIFTELNDPVPEVRCSAIYSLGNFLKNSSNNSEHATIVAQEIVDNMITNCLFDGSVLVREQLLVALQYFVLDFEFILCKYFLNLIRKLNMNIDEEMAIDEIEEYDESEDAAALEILGEEKSTWEEEQYEIMRRERRRNEDQSFTKAVSYLTSDGSQISALLQSSSQPQQSRPNSAQSSIQGSRINGKYPQSRRSSTDSSLSRQSFQIRQSQFGRPPARRPSGAFLAARKSLQAYVNAFDCEEVVVPFPRIAPRSKVYGPSALSLRDSIFRKRALKQVLNLERRTFKDPFERVWLALLTLALDPFEKVANMAQILVRHVEEASLTLQHSTEKRLATSASLHSFNVANGTESRSSEAEISTGMLSRSMESDNGEALEIKVADAFNSSNYGNKKKVVLNREASSYSDVTKLPELLEHTEGERLPEASKPSGEKGNFRSDNLSLPNITAAPLENLNSQISELQATTSLFPQRAPSVDDALPDVTRTTTVALPYVNDISSELARSSDATRMSAAALSNNNKSPSSQDAQLIGQIVLQNLPQPPELARLTRMEGQLPATELPAPLGPLVQMTTQPPHIQLTDMTQGQVPAFNPSVPPPPLFLAALPHHPSVVLNTVNPPLASPPIRDSSSPPQIFGVPPANNPNEFPRPSNDSVSLSVPPPSNSNSAPSNANGVHTIPALVRNETATETPMFVVGSPGAVPPSPATVSSSAPILIKPPLSHVSVGRVQRRKLIQTSEPGMRQHKLADYNVNSIAATMHHFYAKRTLTGRFGGNDYKFPNPHPQAGQPLPSHQPIISTEFVSWCSSMFASPMLHLVNTEKSLDGLGDSMVTKSNPSAFAHSITSQMIMEAKLELDVMREGSRTKLSGIRKAQPVECNVQQFAIKTEKMTSSISFSTIRPYIYTTDGEFVSMFKYNKSKCELERRVHNLAGNNFVEDRAIWLKTINSMSHELIMVGSANGLIRLWDPNFDENGDDLVLQQPFVVSTFHSLASALRHPLDYIDSSSNPARYAWDQGSGRITISGNVKVLRVWDCHSERVLLDVPLGSKRMCSVTALAGDYTNSHLFAAGFLDGLVSIYDERLPVKESRILTLDDLMGSVKGISIHSNERSIVTAASADGRMCVWDPRMFREPIVDVPLGKMNDDGTDDIISIFNVHENGQLMASALPKPEVQIFDIGGMPLSSICMNDITGRALSNPTAMEFHPLRPVLAVATSDHYLATYGPPPVYKN